MPPRRRTTKKATRTRSTGRAAPSARRTDPPPVLGPGERLWLLDVPYAERGVASASGARYHSGLRATIYVGPDLPVGLTPYASKPFSWERWQEDSLNLTPGQVSAAAHTLTPRPHQHDGAAAIVRAARAGARGFLLADEVGLGKTITALEAVRGLQQIRPVRTLLVVCPLAVVAHWRRTIADLGLHDDGIRACVINYDRLKKLLDVPASAHTAKRTATKNRRIAKDGTSLVDWDVVIFDECHRIKNPQSQRAQAAAKIARYAAKREDAAFTVWMSATAAQTPLEISYTAPLLAQLTKTPGSALRDFGPWLAAQGFNVAHEPRFDTWTWTDDPSERTADVERMRALLFDRKTPVALRRLPTDIAGWPEIVRSLMPVDLPPHEWRLYQEAWTAFRREMKLAQRGNDPKAGFVARLRFKQKASLLRIAGTVDHALDLLDNGHQVAIFCEFLESVDLIRDALERHKVPVAVMDGRDPGGREDQRLRFQRGDARVCLFTPPEGFSLHQEEVLADGSHATSAPRSLIVHDVRYSAIATLQAEGRTHRDGKAAQVYYMFAADTVEETIVRTLLGRIESTKAMVGDDVDTIRELEALLDGA